MIPEQRTMYVVSTLKKVIKIVKNENHITSTIKSFKRNSLAIFLLTYLKYDVEGSIF